MKKISTLFKKDPNDLGRVINEINPENEWVINDYGDVIPTQKLDGSACAVIDGRLYKRYDCKIDKKTGEYKKPIPTNAIPCQGADKLSGHHPHWVEVRGNNPENKYHIEAWQELLGDDFDTPKDGTYELCGPKINGNNESLKTHLLIPHGHAVLNGLKDFSFENIKKYLEATDIEGIVFHNVFDDRMCKIRKSDFGIKR